VPNRLEALCGSLLRAMHNGGMLGFDQAAWFNGGLPAEGKDDAGEKRPPSALPLLIGRLGEVLETTGLGWTEIDPAITGTLFERGLDPAAGASP
jgi:hypothetical protein